MKKWYVIFTKKNSEQKVCNFFQKNGYEFYFPQNRLFTEDMEENIKILKVPLFDSYVFVKLSDTEISILKKCNDIINMVFFLGRPIQIDDIELDYLKRFVNENFNIRLEKTNVRLNSISRLFNKVSDYYGYDNLSQSNINKTIITVPSLGYILIADISDRNIGETILNSIKKKSFFNFF